MVDRIITSPLPARRAIAVDRISPETTLLETDRIRRCEQLDGIADSGDTGSRRRLSQIATTLFPSTIAQFGEEVPATAMSYDGGKGGSGVWQKIISMMPPHQIYVEPFLGGGTILQRKRPAAWNIGLDLDADAVAAVRSIGVADELLTVDALK